MSTEVDEFLAHYGVPGMKWGKRKAGETKASRKAANRKTLKEFGDKRLAVNGGSSKKAIAKSVGKMAGVNFAVNTLVANIPPGKVKLGVAAVGTVVQLGSMAKGINEIRAINESRRASENG
jgi:hypothetical protein